MLNWAARYFPILRILRRQITDGQAILEIGSGSYGPAHFYRHRFVGCDVKFPRPRIRPLLPVICSATKLPFPDGSFEAVIASDVFEHIPPTDRQEAVREALRVTRKVAVFGFPSGPLAFALEGEFLEHDKSLRRVPPEWLEEHMLHPFPSADLFMDFRDKWLIEDVGNESLRFHDRVNRMEMSRIRNYFFRLLLALVPRLVERAPRAFDREPFYRRIFVLSPRPDQGAAPRCPQAN